VAGTAWLARVGWHGVAGTAWLARVGWHGVAGTAWRICVVPLAFVESLVAESERSAEGIPRLPKVERIGDRRATGQDAVPPAGSASPVRDDLASRLHGHLRAPADGNGDSRSPSRDRDGPSESPAHNGDGSSEGPAHNGDGSSESPAHNGDGPPGSRPDDRDGHDYWADVANYERMWQQHLERWPDPPGQAQPDRVHPDDPPGSWRGDGGRYLTPDQNASADRSIARLREPEPAITADLRQLEHDNHLGGYLAGLDHRLKGDQRLKEKIADAAKAEIGAPDQLPDISDAIRYTFCFSQNNYVEGYGYVTERLETMGYQMVYSKNRWHDDPQYKGINTRWIDTTGARFELQFHSPESFHAKEVLTHRSYERLRSPVPDRLEREQLTAYQRAVCSALPEPPGVDIVPDLKRDPDA
jgi:hypothetical protein